MRVHAAAARRLRKAERLMCSVLAGGFGRAAQESAWDRIRPTWREDLEAVLSLGQRDGAHIDYQGLSRQLNDKTRQLARPWYRLLMQTLSRRIDAQPPASHNLGWMGGYPIR